MRQYDHSSDYSEIRVIGAGADAVDIALIITSAAIYYHDLLV